MNPPDYYAGMKKHFGIKNAGRFLDGVLCAATGQAHLDVFILDDWLKEQDPSFSKDNESTESFIVRKYGEAAAAFVRSAI